MAALQEKTDMAAKTLLRRNMPPAGNKSCNSAKRVENQKHDSSSHPTEAETTPPWSWDVKGEWTLTCPQLAQILELEESDNPSSHQASPHEG